MSLDLLEPERDHTYNPKWREMVASHVIYSLINSLEKQAHMSICAWCGSGGEQHVAATHWHVQECHNWLHTYHWARENGDYKHMPPKLFNSEHSTKTAK